MSEEARCPKSGRHCPAEALTLIELLVVIAIIGLLAALLLPALNRAKNQGTEAVDMNNLKQISAAVQMYAAENGDYLPAPNWQEQDFCAYAGWLYTLNINAQGPAEFVIAKGLIWPVLTDQRLYMCAMDDTNTPLFQERGQQLSSYVINGAIVGYQRTNYPAEKLGAMQPDNVAFWETDETEPDWFNDGANQPFEGVTARHDNGAIMRPSAAA